MDKRLVIGGIVAGSVVAVTGAVIGVRKLLKKRSSKKEENTEEVIVENLDETNDDNEPEIWYTALDAIDDFLTIYASCDDSVREKLNKVDRTSLVLIKDSLLENDAELTITEDQQQKLIDALDYLFSKLKAENIPSAVQVIDKVNNVLKEIVDEGK